MVNIIPFVHHYLEGFSKALGSVARERKYLAFLDAPPQDILLSFVEQQLEQEMPHFLAINKEEQVVGWCDISPLDRPVFSHVGTLGMGVVPEFRGQGIGERLIVAALEKAKDRGLTRIELTVRESNLPAIKLYQKVGFEIEGVHKNAVFIDGHYENHVCMALLYLNQK